MTANPSSENPIAAVGTQNVRGSGLSVASGSGLYLWINGQAHDYKVCFRLPAGDAGYVGAYRTAKKPREGEDWKRGSDLPDGPFTQETLDKISQAIADSENPNA